MPNLEEIWLIVAEKLTRQIYLFTCLVITLVQVFRRYLHLQRHQQYWYSSSDDKLEGTTTNWEEHLSQIRQKSVQKPQRNSNDKIICLQCCISDTDTAPVVISQEAQLQTLGNICAKFEQIRTSSHREMHLIKLCVYICCCINDIDTAAVIQI